MRDFFYLETLIDRLRRIHMSLLASEKLREGSLDNSAVSDVSINNKDPFTEGLESPECVSILMNYMKNLEKQVGQIFKMLEKTEDRQIKDEYQQTDLVKGVDFITQKFDEYEKNRREKDAIIATLQNELKILRKKWKGKNSIPGEIAF